MMDKSKQEGQFQPDNQDSSEISESGIGENLQESNDFCENPPLLEADVRATDALIGRLLAEERALAEDSERSGAVDRIAAASEIYLLGSKKNDPAEGLQLTDGDPKLLSKTQSKRQTWRGVSSVAAVILIALTLSIIYIPTNTPITEQTKPDLVAAEVLDTEMDSLWDELGTLEEDVLVKAYYIPLAESAAYFALTEMDDAMDDLEADLNSF